MASSSSRPAWATDHGGNSGDSPTRPSSGRRGTQSHPPQAFFGGQTWGAGAASGSNAGLAMSGSLRDVAAMAASVASPLQYNSPTKRFGYTRWPPLFSPTPPDHYDTHTHAHGSGLAHGGQDDGYADVRLEVEQSGHNLTSVMMDPRAPGGVSPELEVRGVRMAGGR